MWWLLVVSDIPYLGLFIVWRLRKKHYDKFVYKCGLCSYEAHSESLDAVNSLITHHEAKHFSDELARSKRIIKAKRLLRGIIDQNKDQAAKDEENNE